MKNNRSRIVGSRRILCFSQVGRRRFLSKDGSSFGWVYCGSHNFSAAGWGQPISDRQPNGSVRINSVLAQDFASLIMNLVSFLLSLHLVRPTLSNKILETWTTLFCRLLCLRQNTDLETGLLQHWQFGKH